MRYFWGGKLIKGEMVKENMADIAAIQLTPVCLE